MSSISANPNKTFSSHRTIYYPFPSTKSTRSHLLLPQMAHILHRSKRRILTSHPDPSPEYVDVHHPPYIPTQPTKVQTLSSPSTESVIAKPHIRWGKKRGKAELTHAFAITDVHNTSQVTNTINSMTALFHVPPPACVGMLVSQGPVCLPHPIPFHSTHSCSKFIH